MRSTVDLICYAAEAPSGAAEAAPKAPARGVKAKGNGGASKPRKVKAKAKKAAPKAKGKGKGKAKAPRVRDPAKLDAWGIRKGSLKSRAAAMYAKGKGATLKEVEAEVGSIQYNVLKELEAAGHKVTRTEVKVKDGRNVTRFHLAHA